MSCENNGQKSSAFAALRKRYLASFPDKIQALRDASEQSNCDQVIRLVHQLAGSSGSYGFGELSQRCLRLEEAGAFARDDLSAARQMLEEILALMQNIYERELQPRGASGDN